MNDNWIDLTRAEKKLISDEIIILLKMTPYKFNPELDQIKLIKLSAFDNYMMALSFKLDDTTKIKWLIYIKERRFCDEKNNFGLTEKAMKIFTDIYETTCDDTEEVIDSK